MSIADATHTTASLATDFITPETEIRHSNELELSVVMPCLNEHETVGICVQKALHTIVEHGIRGEVILADNGSTDGSIEIARDLGARIVPVSAKGYGSALMGGIAAARGRFIIMGDADDSYDFREIPKFIAKLRDGAELVQGCRLPSGGGTVMPGAMPALHRWWGNPMFSWMVRVMFEAPIHDVYCGLRGFTKEMYLSLEQRCTGMEFATEMVIKASLFRKRIAEVPTTLYPDGRKTRLPHLKTFRDGWRTLRFFLMYSPRWLFLIPGLLLLWMGMLGYLLALPGATIFGAVLDVHTLLCASLCLILGFEALAFAVITKTYAVTSGFHPSDPLLTWFYKVMNLERALVLGSLLVLAGTGLLGTAVYAWQATGFGELAYGRGMRLVIPGVTCVVVGVQMIFSSFVVSLLGLPRK